MIKKKVLSNRVEYRNDKNELHREDGPAVEYYGGKKLWYINGVYYSEKDPSESFEDDILKIKLERLKRL
jgi:hypothetical protein